MKKSSKVQNKGPSVVDTYETEIEFTCPVRGKVKQKVKVKRLEAAQPQQAEEVRLSNSITEQLDRKFSGLFLDGESEEDEDLS